MEIKNPFRVVTAESLKQLTLRHYGAGRELKEGDLIISGFTICLPTSTEVQSSSFTKDEASYLNIVLFALDKEQQMIYQLYNQK